MIAVFLGLIDSSLAFEHTVYDDFETGDVNAARWTNGGSPIAQDNFPYNGTYVANTENGDDSHSKDLSLTMGTSGKYVLEFYVRQFSAPANTVGQPAVYNDAGTYCVQFNVNYPTTEVWGFDDGGWRNFNVSSTSGDGDTTGQYARVRILANNDNGLFSVRFGNATTDTVTDNPYNAGCNDIQEIKLEPTTGNFSWDLIHVWNYSLYGWDWPPPEPVANLTITATDIYTSTSINTFNLTVNGSFYSTTTGSIETTIPTNADSLFNITIQGECGSIFCNYSTETYTNWNASDSLDANLTYWYNSNSTHNSSVFEYQTQNIILRVNHSNSSFTHWISDVSARLYYNGTTYSSTKASYSNYTIFTANFITPSVINNSNIDFTWYYNITRNTATNSSITTASISGSQYVVGIGIDNCSTYTTHAINFTIRNESNEAVLTGDLGGHFSVWIDSESRYREFNLSWATSNNFSICINNETANYVVSGQMEYDASGFTAETYYFVNTTINSATDLIDLYLSGGSTSVLFTVTDENDQPIEDAYIYINVYDITTDTSTTTEIIKTSSEGTAIGQIVLNTQRYVFMIIYGGEMVYESENVILTQSTYTLRVTLGTDYLETFDKIFNVACSLTYDNASKQFSYSYVDTTGNVAEGCLFIDRYSGSTSQTVNSSCITGSSGTISLTISPPTGLPTYVGRGSVYIDGVQFVCGNSTSYTYDVRHETFGNTGALYSFLILATLVGLGIWSPAIASVLAVFALVISSLLGLFHLNYSYLISLIIIGGIVFYKLSAR